MYFAKLDENNMVTQVIVAGQDFINTQPGTWVQTDINGISPKNYAGPGYTYDENLGGFIAPKPFNSWLLDTNTCRWKAPTPKPNDGGTYIWNENSVSWESI